MPTQSSTRVLSSSWHPLIILIPIVFHPDTQFEVILPEQDIIYKKKGSATSQPCLNCLTIESCSAFVLDIPSLQQ